MNFSFVKRFKFIPAVCMLLLLVVNSSSGQTVNVATNFQDTLLCVKGSFSVPLAVTGEFDDTNIFKIEISNATGSFSNPTLVGYGYGNGNGGTSASCTLPSSISAGTGYRLRVVAMHPTYTSGPNADNIRVSAYPTMNITPPSPACLGSTLNIKVSTTAPSPTISWLLPNGGTIPSGVSYTKTNSAYTDSGMYRITVTSYKCSSTDSVRALVLPQPVFDGWDTDSIVCEGEKFNIKPSCNVCSLPAGQVNYNWTFPPAGVSGQSFISLLTTAKNNQGWFKLTMTIGNCSASDSFFARIKPVPQIPTANNNSPVCLDDVLTLSVSSNVAAPTYKWVGPNGFTSNLANISRPNIKKLDEGDYYVSVSENGCESAPTKTTAIIGTPVGVLKLTGDTTLCPGDKLQISAQTNVATGIEWKKINNPNLIVSTSRTLAKTSVSAEDEGKYLVTQQILGCTSQPAYINITVPNIKKPMPENNGPLCLGETLTFNAVATDNGTYSWKGPHGFSSIEQNPEIGAISKADEGVYVITTELDYCTETDSTTVTTKPSPVITNISSNGPVCLNHMLELYSESNTTGSTFEWWGPNGFKSDEPNPSFNYNEQKSGKYYLRIAADGCSSIVSHIDVTTREAAGDAAAYSNTPITEEETLRLFGNNTKPGVEYHWKGPAGFTSNEQNPVITGATFRYSGRYELTCVYDGCSTTTYTEVYVKDILGIKLYLYPNPNTGKFTITGLSQTDELHYIAVRNTMGELVYRGELYPDKARFEADIDMSGVASGVYILFITSASEKRIERFTVVHP